MAIPQEGLIMFSKCNKSTCKWNSGFSFCRVCWYIIIMNLVVWCLLFMSGCNTIAGIGDDMKALAQGTQDYLAGEPSTDRNYRGN